MVYARFVNMLTQKPTTVQLAPFQAIQDTEETAGSSSQFEYEPDEEQILADSTGFFRPVVRCLDASLMSFLLLAHKLLGLFKAVESLFS